MPLYEYRCDACEHQFEVIQKFSDDPISVCPKCGAGPVVKLLSSPAFQFKGTGWYVTDYAKKSGGDGSKGEGSGKESSKEGGKEGGKEGKEAAASSSDAGESASSSKSEASKATTASGSKGGSKSKKGA
jgi:putative FmdB family regulatory protein